MSHLRKYLLREITAPTKLLTRNIQDHPYLPATPLNHLDPDQCAVVAAHRDSTNELPPILFLSKSSSVVLRIFPTGHNNVPYSIPNNNLSIYTVISPKSTDKAPKSPTYHPPQLTRLSINTPMHLTGYKQRTNPTEVTSPSPRSTTIPEPTSDTPLMETI